METSDAHQMNPAQSRKRSFWLGAIAALITLLGTYALLEGTAVFLGRVWEIASGTQILWADNLFNAKTNAWLALYPLAFVSSLFAGLVGAWLGPKHSRAMLVTLVALSLAVVLFQPLPPKLSVIILTFWAACWPLGICAGVLLLWRHEVQA